MWSVVSVVLWMRLARIKLIFENFGSRGGNTPPTHTRSCAKARAIFDEIDKDGSGAINVDEIELLAKRFFDGREPPPKRLQRMVEFLDVDGDGSVRIPPRRRLARRRRCARLTRTHSAGELGGVLAADRPAPSSERRSARNFLPTREAPAPRETTAKSLQHDLAYNLRAL